MLETQPLPHDLDPADLAHAQRLTAEQRLAESASWNLVSTQLEIAAAHAKAAARSR